MQSLETIIFNLDTAFRLMEVVGRASLSLSREEQSLERAENTSLDGNAYLSVLLHEMTRIIDSVLFWVD